MRTQADNRVWLRRSPSLQSVTIAFVTTPSSLFGSQFLTEACRMCSRDPLVHHELGVLAYRNNE